MHTHEDAGHGDPWCPVRMTIVGFHASHEQIAPSRLLAAVQAAEQAGFDAAMCSDHFEPWSARQGQSGYTWSWLGAALATTGLSFGTVTAPGQRYHPAIIAQATATLAEMFPERFWVCLGTGQWMNEHITGDRWPRKEERNQRLLECIDIIRRLHAGETVSHDGLVTVDNATLYTRPAVPPKLIQPAIFVETAVMGAGWGADGVATINQPIDHLRRLIDAYREAGGDGELYLQVHLSWAPTRQEALAIARDQWRTNTFGAPANVDLTAAQLEQVSEHVPDEAVERAVLVDDDLGRLAARIRELVDLGFDRVYLHHVGQEQKPFIDAAADRLLADLR